jgi:hypothetical protein
MRGSHRWLRSRRSAFGIGAEPAAVVLAAVGVATKLGTGWISDLGNGVFTLDPGLKTGHFEATYPMSRREGDRQQSIGRSASS